MILFFCAAGTTSPAEWIFCYCARQQTKKAHLAVSPSLLNVQYITGLPTGKKMMMRMYQNCHLCAKIRGLLNHSKHFVQLRSVSAYLNKSKFYST